MEQSKRTVATEKEQVSKSEQSKKAVILLSGGLDSTTVLAMAKAQGYTCYAMSFDYGQRHRAELVAAKRVADALGAKEHRVMTLNFGELGGSALTDESIDVPEELSEGIPVTYVPARNTVFLSLALGWAEIVGAYDIFIGVNAIDYSGYPDCRPEFIEAFERLANLATKVGVEGQSFKIQTPLKDMSKADIIRCGTELGIDYRMTVSCYQANTQGQACGVCDSCRLREKGFVDAGLVDATVYLGSD
ncbi:7-cyano-7-deazaguanine synthase QueC [Spartinivicinus ruber]|uniref:7-cyano-7-deazaguanine synthase QueC n=1 Tax=Spartinivicinus ruber TaxID=2683272 RepID=UPI0013D4E756|nr:7-cyano-7-deazaguanine synthase QueC [Spartinivicinus ruber]